MKKMSALQLLLVCCFSLFSTVNLSAACVCPQTTGCVPQPCTGCACCPIRTNEPCIHPSGNTYTLLNTVTGVHGAMTFIGNALGLSKVLCSSTGTATDGNNPGPPNTDAIGAFMTTDMSLTPVGSYQKTTGLDKVTSQGNTTLDWTKNSSTAVLNLPAGSKIFYAVLFWSGSYGYFCEEANIGVLPDCILNAADTTQVRLTTPDGVTHLITPDSTTGMESQNPGTPVCGGNYVRTSKATMGGDGTDISSILSALANPNGVYTVGGVPGTIAGTNNTQNAAGWTLAIFYTNPSITDINNLSLFVSNQQAQNDAVAEVSGFCSAAAQGATGVNARLLVSAIETDANKAGDSMLFGITNPPTNGLTGPNNFLMNFFGSQINQCTPSDPNLGQLDTNGTYGTLNGVTGPPNGSNQDAFTQTLCFQGRQGYDITNVDVSPYIPPNTTHAFTRATTSGDDYMVNALGLQISVNAPIIFPVKTVNGVDSIQSNVGDTVTFKVVLDNTGTGDGTLVSLIDVLETGLMLNPPQVTIVRDFPPGPVVVPITQAQLATTGVPLGDIPASPTPGNHVEVTYTATIVSPPVSGNIFHNQVTTPFAFFPCGVTDPLFSFNLSNIVTITLPENPPMPPPTNFVGRVKKCPMMNGTVYSLFATWDPVNLPTVVAYLILRNGVVVASVPATGPFEFQTYLEHRSDATQFSIVAQYQNGTTSAPLNIRIIE